MTHIVVSDAPYQSTYGVKFARRAEGTPAARSGRFASRPSVRARHSMSYIRSMTASPDETTLLLQPPKRHLALGDPAFDQGTVLIEFRVFVAPVQKTIICDHT